MVLDRTTEEGRLFQTGIVLGEKGIFQGINIGKWSCDSCDARVRLKLGAGVMEFVFIKRHRTRVYLVEEG